MFPFRNFSEVRGRRGTEEELEGECVKFHRSAKKEGPDDSLEGGTTAQQCVLAFRCCCCWLLPGSRVLLRGQQLRCSGSLPCWLCVCSVVKPGQAGLLLAACATRELAAG